MEKGRVDENSSDYFIKQVLDRHKGAYCSKIQAIYEESETFWSY